MTNKTEKEYNLHATVDQKKVSVVHSQGHKPKNDTNTEILAQATNRLSEMAIFFETILDSPPVDEHSYHYKEFVKKLALSKDESNNFKNIKQQVDLNFISIYKLAPKVKSVDANSALFKLVAAQESFFKQLLNLDIQDYSVDMKIEKLCADYKSTYSNLIDKYSSTLSACVSRDSAAIKAIVEETLLTRLKDANDKTIEAFKKTAKELKAAKVMLNDSQDIYKKAVVITGLTCLYILSTAAGVTAGSVMLPLSKFISFGILVGACTAYLANKTLFPPSRKAVSKQTEKFVGARKQALDSILKNLESNCKYLRQAIAFCQNRSFAPPPQS